jgi:hypothetical protein
MRFFFPSSSYGLHPERRCFNLVGKTRFWSNWGLLSGSRTRLQLLTLFYQRFYRSLRPNDYPPLCRSVISVRSKLVYIERIPMT